MTIRKGTRVIIAALVSGDGTDPGDLAPLAKKAYKAGL